ncbi:MULTISPECIES: hypothetical protein [unclassified Streptomyces]|uniref:vWA-MoxR associated conflict system protein n=1 Tax=unclassified Streptomyces TaxID=2593676 RepID=UPI0011E83D36|nr:hypothetical protein [Streptomyces sp. sk2.1]TXS68081.1 hypothetical protein EAO76_35725 [Streptomyces sp. sk2.1]
MDEEPRRHLLVVAPQCASMRHLTRLGEAASALHAALVDPDTGDCAPGLPDGRSLIVDERLTSNWIRTLIGEAISHAEDRGASLVLALLGHGFVPGSTHTLYLMGADSVEDAPERAVNVGELLAAAANRPGIPGVLGIVDTCHAAGATPPGQDLTGGAGNGRSRLAVLMSASLTQQAVDLSFSRALTGLIRKGVPGAGPLLGADDVQRALRGSVVGQDVTVFQHDGDPFATGRLWVTRNAQDRGADPGGLLGRLAHEDLTEAFGALPAAVPAPHVPHDVPSALDALKALGCLPPSPARDRAREAVLFALTALRTVGFLRGWIGGELTTARLRQALRALLASEHRALSSPLPEFTDVAILDRLAFDHSVTRSNGKPSVAEFVVRLALASGKDLASSELHAWARSVDAQQELNDAVAKVLDDREDQQLRLAVGLDSSLTGGWPETVSAWLLRDGELLERQDFDCPTVDRAGAEAAVEEAAVWAEDHAEALGLRLRWLDIAVPSGVLLEWRPEEAGRGLRFGVQYDVVLHWSRRLAPDPLLRRIQGAVNERWEEIAACTGVPVDWLDASETSERPPLQGKLRDGMYRRAIGLTHHAGLDDQLMEILLSYTPVLLWPQGAEGFPVDRHHCLEPQWLTMPEGLGRAYQRRWRGEYAGHLADLRAVWDDRAWLRFCRLVRTTVPPVQNTIEETS